MSPCQATLYIRLARFKYSSLSVCLSSLDVSFPFPLPTFLPSPFLVISFLVFFPFSFPFPFPFPFLSHFLSFPSFQSWFAMCYVHMSSSFIRHKYTTKGFRFISDFWEDLCRLYRDMSGGTVYPPHPGHGGLLRRLWWGGDYTGYYWTLYKILPCSVPHSGWHYTSHWHTKTLRLKRFKFSLFLCCMSLRTFSDSYLPKEKRYRKTLGSIGMNEWVLGPFLFHREQSIRWAELRQASFNSLAKGELCSAYALLTVENQAQVC